MSDRTDRVFTIRMTRALEDNVFSKGISIYEMMETAGKVVAEEIDSFARKSDMKKIVFVAGYGNNGGDAIVAARYLLQQDYSCDIILIGNKKEFNSGASQKNFQDLKKTCDKDSWNFIKSAEEVTPILKKYDEEYILVDAIFGIGISGEIREPYKATIEYLNNEYKGDIVALDIPSGYNPETEYDLIVKNPKKIICLGRNKIMKGDFKGAEVVVRNIGIPDEAENYIGIGDLKWYYPKRKENSHKRENGVVTVIAGSIEYIGAPALVGFGAFRTGADLIFILTPSNIRNTVALYSPDFITIPAHENEIEPSDIDKLFSNPRIEGSSFVIGPGMMNSEITKDTLFEVLKSKQRKQIIIDASALSMMEEEHLFLLEYHDTILTPHRGEFHRIFKIKLSGNVKEDLKIVEEMAAKWKTTILLKGEIDIITDGTITKYNQTGHPGMTVGGTGDVLTGIVASIFSVTKKPFISACLGAYISGAAGELAARSYGDGLIASDIPNFIHSVIVEALNFEAKEI